jgi:(p)ppGpp synthase/HD superfamily hydrolase
MERPDGDGLIAMFFSVQVKDRSHLARIMRGLKHVDAVRRVQRART